MLRTVLLVALCACAKSAGDETTKPPPAAVEVGLTKASLAKTPKYIVLTGIVAAKQRAEVTADAAGKVLVVKVERGDTVKFGDPLVQLDVRNATLGAREVQANLASARAQRSLAEEECKRTQSLLDKGAITKSEYDRQMTTCQSALQQVSALEARAAMMTKSVADGIVRAPFAGTIGERMVSPGEWVAPGRPLFVLVEVEPLKIELSVPEVAIQKIKPNDPIQLRAVADPDRMIGAKISRIGAEIGRTRSLIVEATIDPNSRLVPGMFAEAFITTELVDRVVVPKDAVVRRCSSVGVGAGSGSGSGSAAPPPDEDELAQREKCKRIGKPRLFVLGKNNFLEERIVQPGPLTPEGMVSVVSGVKPGELVVAKVTDDIVDGLHVKPPADAKGTK